MDRPARLDISDTPLNEALRELRRTSGVPLAYSADLLPNRSVDCACRDASVREALQTLLRGTDLVFEEGRSQVLIGPRTPKGSVVGRITDRESGWALPTAEVIVLETGERAVADGRGLFRFDDLAPGRYTLSAEVLGYNQDTTSLELDGNGPVTADLRLERTPISLDEIVITPGSFGILSEGLATMGAAVTREDIEAIPQVGDDVFRTLKRMPGVASGDISARLNVRGSTDRNLLVMIDGVELYEPYHLKDLDAAFGIVDVQALGGINLITGGFSAEHGDKRGGVFDMTTRRPPANGTRTTVGFSLSTASLIQQGSFAEGRGSWVASLRRGWLDIILKLVDVDDDLSPSYWDTLGRLDYLINDDHLISAEFLMAGDDMEWGADGRGRIESDWINAYGWLTWKANLSPRLRANTIVSLGVLNRSRVGRQSDGDDGLFSPLAGFVRDSADFNVAGIRQDWSFDLSENVLLKWGLDAKTANAEYDYGSEATFRALDENGALTTRTDTTQVRVSPSGREIGTYLATRVRPHPSFMTEVGVRFDHQTHTDDSDWAPRLLTRWDLTSSASLKASWGRYFQSHGLHELQAQDGQTGFNPSERAEQVALGLEVQLRRGFLARMEAYRRTVDRPLPTYVNLSRSVNPLTELESDRAILVPDEGRAAGVEFFLSQTRENGDWAASYVVSKAEDLIDGQWAPRTMDQRHAVNVSGSWRPARNWQFSASWQIRSGWPFTEQALEAVQIENPDNPDEPFYALKRGFAPYNQSSLPAYHRLDIRATRSFDIRDGRLELYLDVFNAYNRENVRGYEYYLQANNGRFTTHRDVGTAMLPRLPTIGFRWVF